MVRTTDKDSRRIIPLRNYIYEILEKKKSITLSELMRGLEKDVGRVSLSEVERELMAMEIRGILRVFASGKKDQKLEFVGSKA
ncbi:MAG: transcriptional repressor [Thermoproteota archaeon]